MKNLDQFSFLRGRTVIFWMGFEDRQRCLELYKNQTLLNWHYYCGNPLGAPTPYILDGETREDIMHIIFPSYPFKKEIYEAFPNHIEYQL